MGSEDILMFGIPTVAFVVAAVIAYLSAKARSGLAFGMIGLLWAAFTAMMFFGMENASGWDGLGYAIALLGLSAPAGAGLGLGGLVGWLKSGKTIYA